MEEETRQARFIIGMALLICVLIVLSNYFASPAVQLILPSESAQTETSETEAVSTSETENTPAEQTGKVNINTATAEELQTLPGIGETLADRILSYRAANGAFTDIRQLMEVEGIGEKKFEAIANLITVE